MADKVIDVPGFGPTAFPDSMSDEQIVAAIQKQHPDLSPKQEAPGILDRISSAMKSPVAQAVLPSAPLIPGFVAGVRDAVVGSASAVKHALLDPATEADKVGGANLPYVPMVANRLLVRPQLAQYDQAKAMGDTAPWSKDRILKGVHTVASVVPVAGPIIGAMADRAASGDIEGAAGMGTAAWLAPKLLSEGIPAAAGEVERMAPKVGDVFKPEPVITFLRALGTSDPTAREWIPKLMDELNKAGNVKTVDDARVAIKKRMDVYNPAVEKILEPQKDVVVPGSRAEHLQARIEAIPERIRLDDPAKYQAMVKDAQNSVGKGSDYTIGELDNLRKSYERSVKHNQSISASMTADESTAAMDRASERFIIGKFYDSLQDVPGGASVQGIKSQIGAMLKGEEALSKRANRAAIQSGQALPAKIVEGAGHMMRPGKYAENFGSGVTSMINSDLASSLRRWSGAPPEIPSEYQVPPMLQRPTGNFKK